MATETLPPSSTTWPRASSLASRPATRTAEGPMSTPRRDWPRSRGTPSTRIFLLVMLGLKTVFGEVAIRILISGGQAASEQHPALPTSAGWFRSLATLLYG